MFPNSQTILLGQFGVQLYIELHLFLLDEIELRILRVKLLFYIIKLVFDLSVKLIDSFVYIFMQLFEHFTNLALSGSDLELLVNLAHE